MLEEITVSARTLASHTRTTLKNTSVYRFEKKKKRLSVILFKLKVNAERLQRTSGDTSYVLEDSAEASVRQACMSNGNIHRSPTLFCSVNRRVQAQEQDDCMSEKGETRRGVGRQSSGAV